MTGSQKYYAAHRDEVIRRSKEWNENNRARSRALKLASWRRRYHSVPRPGKDPKRGQTGICAQCGGAVSRPPSQYRKGKAKFCSTACYAESMRKGQRRLCVSCGHPFYARPDQIKRGWGRFCSMSCRPGRDLEKLRRERRRGHDKRRARLAGAKTIHPVNYECIAKRDRMRCHICHRKVVPAQLHFDHVIPLAAGGEHTEENIAVSHARCNLRKQAKTLTLF